jgi:hypothetical protein
MTLEEAIKTLRRWEETAPMPKSRNICQAMRLGIEALKWYKGAKEDGCIRSDYFLPGETEE